MTKLPSVRPREVLAVLGAAGFTIVRIKGSHYQLRHLTSGRRVTVPFHNRDMTRATLASILDQAGPHNGSISQVALTGDRSLVARDCPRHISSGRRVRP